MDIAICSLEGHQLKYAGALIPVWIIRDGEIIEIKGNRHPIGRHGRNKPYTTHTFNFQKGDTIYIFSDGFVDQFGGEKGKKFKTQPFRDLLLKIQGKIMYDQKTILYKTFEDWKGTLEQIDDVCVIGIRV
jgi:serine phosphatase RsbU (regulator of sigma subunit)